jgi:hypothetical protein
MNPIEFIKEFWQRAQENPVQFRWTMAILFLRAACALADSGVSKIFAREGVQQNLNTSRRENYSSH